MSNSTTVDPDFIHKQLILYHQGEEQAALKAIGESSEVLDYFDLDEIDSNDGELSNAQERRVLDWLNENGYFLEDSEINRLSV